LTKLSPLPAAGRIQEAALAHAVIGEVGGEIVERLGFAVGAGNAIFTARGVLARPVSRRV
jgi:hypothetical protein